MRRRPGWHLVCSLALLALPPAVGCDGDEAADDAGTPDVPGADDASGADVEDVSGENPEDVSGESVEDADPGDVPGDAVPGDADSGTGDGFCPVVGYAACGGDILGAWAMRSLCPDDPEAAAALCEHPYDDRVECTGPGNEPICDGSVSGTLTFQADGTIDIEMQTTMVATWHFTDGCLAAAPLAGAGAEARCLGMSSERLTCAYGDGCVCVGAPMVQGDSTTATYTITGDDLVIGDDPPATWCVEGDRLTMDYYAFHPVSWRYWVLERP